MENASNRILQDRRMVGYSATKRYESPNAQTLSFEELKHFDNIRSFSGIQGDTMMP